MEDESQSEITTQCPDRHHAVARHVHDARVIGRPVQDVALKKIAGPPTANIFVPAPNHTHVVDNDRVNTAAIWWEVRPVLVLDQSDWPSADGTSGITSSTAMDDADAAGRAIEVGSKFLPVLRVAYGRSLGQPRTMRHATADV